jgi:predicted ThiF/HesA family dinucleotide-utilizing enzyme
MPVEIRELVIQTTIVSRPAGSPEPLSPVQLSALKKQIVQECLRLLQERPGKMGFER